MVERYREKIERMADDIKIIMQQEKEERLVCHCCASRAAHAIWVTECVLVGALACQKLDCERSYHSTIIENARLRVAPISFKGLGRFGEHETKFTNDRRPCRLRLLREMLPRQRTL